jgi:hypothetical protein
MSIIHAKWTVLSQQLLSSATSPDGLRDIDNWEEN